MDNKTGKIVEVDNIIEELTGKELMENFTSVAEEDMTEKQKETKQVSKHDNRSILGKKYKISRQVTRRLQREKTKGY